MKNIKSKCADGINADKLDQILKVTDHEERITKLEKTASS